MNMATTPADNLEILRTALSNIGYCDASLPLSEVQGLFRTYIVTKHTGHHTDIPLNLDSLPDGILKDAVIKVVLGSETQVESEAETQSDIIDPPPPTEPSDLLGGENTEVETQPESEVEQVQPESEAETQPESEVETQPESEVEQVQAESEVEQVQAESEAETDAGVDSEDDEEDLDGEDDEDSAGFKVE